MWALGSGDRPDRAYALAEPWLNEHGADFIVRTLMQAELAPERGYRFLSVAAEAWDDLSEATLRWLTSRVDPVDESSPNAPESQKLWAGFAARLEDEWISRFVQLSEPIRISQLEMLSVHTVNRFSRNGRATVRANASAALRRQGAVSSNLLRVLAAASPDMTPVELRIAIDGELPEGAVVAAVGSGQLEWLSREELARVRASLMASLRDQNAAARAGTVAFGSEDARRILGQLAANSTEDEPDVVALLMENATDACLPAEHLFYARLALTAIRRAGKLGNADLRALHGAGDHGTFPEHGGMTDTLLRASRLQILALELSPNETIAIVADCRADEPRVRQLSIVTAAEAVTAARRTEDRDALSWAVVGGLFDPADDVVRIAVGAVTADFLERHSVTRPLVIERLPRLLKGGSVELRAVVAAVARRLAVERAELADDPVVRSIVLQAESDKSWIVRTAGLA
jgi:hypothetical protein